MQTARSIPFLPARGGARALSSSRSGLAWLLAGGIVATVFELAFAIAWWAPQGVPVTRVLQGAAAWWIGRDAFSGGLPAAALGALLYCHMMIAVVAIYYAASRRWHVLLRRPLLCGMLYGAAMYVLIIEIAVPLFGAYAGGDAGLAWRVSCLVAYMLLVGVTSAWFARRAQRMG